MKKLTWLLAILICSQISFARISLFINNHELNMQGIKIEYFFDTSHQHSFNRYLQISDKLKAFPHENISMSYTEGMYWIKIDVATIPSPRDFEYLLIYNPHINFLGGWILQGDSLFHTYDLTGDHLPFSSRDVHHPQFVFHLKPEYNHASILLLVDKRNEQLHVPINFFNANSFIHYTRENNLLTGLLIGITIFILLFTLFLYLNIREKLYVYYALYVLMVGAYIFSDLGLSFMIFYPDHPALSDFARPFTISQAPIYYILFARSLLNVKTHFPKMFRFTNWVIFIFILLFVMGFVLVPNTGPIRIFWLLLLQIIMVGSILPVIVFAIMGYRNKVKYSAYIIIASTFFTIFTQVYQQYITGNLPDNLLTRNTMNIGFAIEISLLALALSIRFKNYKMEAEMLLRRLNQQQENIFKSISEHQEKEMHRISGLLHDSIGAGLSSIKYNLEAIEINQPDNSAVLKSTIDEVSTLTDEVRNLSHNFSPLLLQQKGLVQTLRDLIAPFNRTNRIQIELELIGSMKSASFQNELLIHRIIQELLQNSIKHAHASEMIIQLMLEPELISIYVEDNGRGFNQNTVMEGLGFSQIRGLVTFVNGRFQVNSQLNKGCRVSVEFPVIPNE